MTGRLALVCGVLVGCGSARVVSQQGNVGTIELSGETQPAMDQANSELAAICGAGNASITSQGFEDGQVWRIHFVCGAARTPPPPPIAAPPLRGPP